MTTSKNITIFLIIWSTIVLVFIIFLIYPLFNEIRGASQNFISQKNRLLELEIRAENFRELQQIYKIYQPDFKKIDQLFINAEEPINFIEFLEEEAILAQISIEMLPFPPKEDDPWPSMDFRLTLEGPFPNFLKFLERLESSIYLIEILNLHLKRLNEDLNEDEGNIEATLLIKVYTKQ